MKFKKLHKLFLIICGSLLWACSTQIDNGPNRRLQNLSARYNLIYNANLLLDAYQSQLAQSEVFPQDAILSVYLTPVPQDTNQITGLLSPELQAIAQKAYTVIQEKNLSNYLDEAYLLLGKVHYYAGHYYMAAEYFDYLERAYPEDKKIQIQAQNWKAKTYLQMGEIEMAKQLFKNTEELILSWKKGGKALKSEAYASLAQFSISQKDYEQALIYLEKAQDLDNHQIARTRWNFVRAQLQETQKNYLASQKSFQKVIRSNAAYTLYFQAQLGKLRNQELNAPLSSQRKEALEKLLQDDKNKDFIGRIYLEIGKYEEGNKQYQLAQQSYIKGLNATPIKGVNAGQLYLQLGELNFKHNNQYIEAKLYYDSALTYLPQNYPGYEALLIKTNNLNYLSSRYQLVNQKDSLLQYAQLSPSDLESALSRKFLIQYRLKEEAVKKAAEELEKQNLQFNQIPIEGDPTFYFSNPVALQKGKNDFQKKWGKRNYEPNWRQSNKSFLLEQTQNKAPQTTSITLSPPLEKDAWIQTQVNQYKAQLPKNETEKTLALNQIEQALLEIGRFYQQEIGDPKEVIQVFENYLKRFPKHTNLAEIHYSLYLAYKKLNDDQAEKHKEIVLSQFAESDFAKTILDPLYFNRQKALEQQLKEIYNQAFNYFQDKNYSEVISLANQIKQRFPGNELQIQFDYLKAIAIGKSSKLPVLLNAFADIKLTYPQDSLIIPLINKQEQFIQANYDQYQKRTFALLDIDSTEVKLENKKTVITYQAAPVVITQDSPKVDLSILTDKPAETQTLPKIKTDGLFTDQSDTRYYFVVAVKSMEHSLSSSRFGIGQFNRGLFGGENLKHQLFDLEEHQVIFVGDFDQLDDVKTYTEEISKQLNKIMKIPSNLYQGFYISKTNFDLIKTSANLERYLLFYKGNLEINEQEQ